MHRSICDEIKTALAVRKGLIRTLPMAPSMSVLTRFDCILCLISLRFEVVGARENGRASASRAPVLFCAHYFKAPTTQAIFNWHGWSELSQVNFLREHDVISLLSLMDHQVISLGGNAEKLNHLV